MKQLLIIICLFCLCSCESGETADMTKQELLNDANFWLNKYDDFNGLFIEHLSLENAATERGDTAQVRYHQLKRVLLKEEAKEAYNEYLKYFQVYQKRK